MVREPGLVGEPDARDEADVIGEAGMTAGMEGRLLVIDRLHKSFGDDEVLKGVNLTLKRGEVLGLIGPSGCGKSTLLRCVNGLEKADAGQVFLSGCPVQGVSGEEARRARERIGMVFQHFNLFAHLTVLENVTIGPEKVKGLSPTEARERAVALLDSVGLGDKAGAYPLELSGGQQQRVAIARALAMDPELLLFDEPTSALDPEMIYEVLDVIRNIALRGTTMIIVTHELSFARRIASRMIFMDRGEILEDLPPESFFRAEGHPRIRTFLRRLSHFEENGGPFPEGGLS